MTLLARRDLLGLVDAAAAGQDVEPVATTLTDGTRALLRPILPTDRDRIARGMQELSPRSRLLRFHAPIDHLTDEQLRYLTEVDYDNHCAWVALDADHPDEPGMGVARYVRLEDEPDVAEAAVTVVDRYQGRGLGTLLLAVLAATAVARGLKVFRNYVLTDNDTMLDLFDRLGAHRVDEGYGVYRIDAPLPADVDELRDSAIGHVLKAAAVDVERTTVLGAILPVAGHWHQVLHDWIEERLPPQAGG